MLRSFKLILAEASKQTIDDSKLRNELESFYTSLLSLNLVEQSLSDEHLYDEDEEEDLVLRYQNVHDDEMDCD